MKKIILLLCFILTILITGCSNSNKETDNKQFQTNITEDIYLDSDITMALTPTEKPTTTPEVTKVVNVEDNELLNNITELCKSPRRFDTDGEQRALNFLNDKMIEYGYQTRTQEFYVYEKTLNDIYSATPWQYFDKYSGEKDSVGKGINLIVTTANPDEKKTLYITAHYDTTRDTNGIRDNCSGVAVVMEIARLLQGIKLPINIEFVFFSGEEAGMQGSASFISQLSHEEKNRALGCINMDVVGEVGDNKVMLKTNSFQINVLSLLMDEFHEFSHARSEASDHFSFYMGGIPAIYFADENVKTKDSTDNPLEELDVEKLKELTRIICDFILNFNLVDYQNLIKNSYTREYTDMPNIGKIQNYSLIQVNKILRDNGSGSDIQYILKNEDGNQVVITEKDSRFLRADLAAEIQTFNTINDYTKYKVLEENYMISVKYADLVSFSLYELIGNVSQDEALELLENIGVFTSNVALINALD
ncbi:MAG: M20/M25/M40 family metallo-hydrolase [Herbinix sp.]|nr:M20/M25/M40 family metallo-hydrolase [Herbinix sp.]